MTSPAVIQLAPRGSWTGRISPAAAARSVGSLPHWAKGLGGSTGARGQGGFEACCSMERVGKWFMKGWKTAKFTRTKEYCTGTAPDVKAVLSWMDTYKGWDGMIHDHLSTWWILQRGLNDSQPLTIHTASPRCCLKSPLAGHLSAPYKSPSCGVDFLWPSSNFQGGFPGFFNLFQHVFLGRSLFFKTFAMFICYGLALAGHSATTYQRMQNHPHEGYHWKPCLVGHWYPWWRKIINIWIHQSHIPIDVGAVHIFIPVCKYLGISQLHNHSVSSCTKHTWPLPQIRQGFSVDLHRLVPVAMVKPWNNPWNYGKNKASPLVEAITCSFFANSWAMVKSWIIYL